MCKFGQPVVPLMTTAMTQMTVKNYHKDDGNDTRDNATPKPKLASTNEEAQPDVDFAASAAAIPTPLSQSDVGADVFADVLNTDDSTNGGNDESTPVNSQERTKPTMSASPIVSYKT